MGILDSTAIVDLISRPQKPERQRLESRLRKKLSAGEMLCTTQINVAEVLVGLHHSGNPPERRALFDATLATLVILELDAQCAEHFGRIKAGLMVAGGVIDDFDTMIAAIALRHQQSVLTRNVKHFSRVPGLVVEDY